MSHLVVLGPMGVGKSTTAQAVAAALGRSHRDSDQDLQQLFGRSGRDIAKEHGVDELHRLETAVLLGALAATEPLVISAAAFVVEDEACQIALSRCARVVVLHAPPEALLARMPAGDHRRTMSSIEVETLAERRAPLFAQVADLSIDATLATDVIAERICQHWP